MARMLWIGALLSALGCRSVRVDPGDLVGTWSVSAASRAAFSSSFPKVDFPVTSAMTLELRADGSFTASELPGELVHVAHPDRADLVSGSGGWKLVLEHGEPKVQLVFTRFDGKQGNVPYGTWLSISAQRSGTYLFFYHGDADAGPRIKFEKKQ
jgi:hypothetical protein